jgi:hypothetical protein
VTTKVYGLFVEEVLMPYIAERLIDVYAREEDAMVEAHRLNKENINPMEEDSYGPLSGCKYFVATLEVK